ncbi:universal stress protein [Haloplanus aerogenes]|uniref:Universal stress protein n=1 Tax=Haloplanus aerogenes TaxID=660522 RepID=A0A3M0CYQ4_9EURY|nr:universal stress protein [Haloplanus aerogenes]AZH26999.1 universal stress protein [Haloplanus aerogenes]RMB13510.1 universal stress protein family protein [Haloplanus aerogenes]
MTFLVPFDGSGLAEAALVRATEFASVFDEDVLAVSVVPKGNTGYARERGWLDRDEPFDLQSVVATLHTQVTDLCPSANFWHLTVDTHASPSTIATRIRQRAQREDVSMVFVGSDNAGHLVTEVSSVGGPIAAAEAYDVVIVRNRTPARIARLADASPDRDPKSDFYYPDKEDEHVTRSKTDDDP